MNTEQFAAIAFEARHVNADKAIYLHTVTEDGLPDLIQMRNAMVEKIDRDGKMKLLIHKQPSGNFSLTYEPTCGEDQPLCLGFILGWIAHSELPY